MSSPEKISGSILRVKNATPENDTWVAQMMQGMEPPGLTFGIGYMNIRDDRCSNPAGPPAKSGGQSRKGT